MSAISRLDEEACGLRAALIRLLWNSYADGAECCCEGDDIGPECEATRALGFGEHWNRRRFEKAAGRPR